MCVPWRSFPFIQSVCMCACVLGHILWVSHNAPFRNSQTQWLCIGACLGIPNGDCILRMLLTCPHCSLSPFSKTLNIIYVRFILKKLWMNICPVVLLYFYQKFRQFCLSFRGPLLWLEYVDINIQNCPHKSKYFGFWCHSFYYSFNHTTLWFGMIWSKHTWLLVTFSANSIPVTTGVIDINDE